MFECENMTPCGCERMDAVKELQLIEMIESWYFDTDTLCKNQCCKECEKIKKCGYRCGRITWNDHGEQFKKEEIGQVSYKQLSFF